MKRSLIALALASAAFGSQAATIFADNFDSYPVAVPTGGLGSPFAPTGNFGTWTTYQQVTSSSFLTPSGSSVDLIGQPTVGAAAFDYYPGNGMYVDLDGTGNTGSGSGIGTIITLTSAPSYNLSFSVGNNSATAPENYTVYLAPITSLSSATALTSGVSTFTGSFSTVSQNFTAAPGTYVLAFMTNVTGDNGGTTIDNVLVTAVPEPGEWAMMLGGLGMIGAIARRRRAR
jgi:hypothetical protein